MDSKSPLDLWISETYQDTVRLGFKVKNTLFSGQSSFQKVDIIETEGHGKMLLNDGIIMLSERDEFIYHEMIAHVPLFVHPNPRRVLIVGGGDGGTAREVLKHKTIENVVMVEIDEMVVNACRDHMPSLMPTQNDPRFEIIIDDGVTFINQTELRFDIIIVDSTDPIGPAKPLFDKDFYQAASSILTEQGILITQAESPFYDLPIQASMLANQKPFFEKLHLYLLSNLTYPGGLWSFGFASKMLCPLNNFKENRVADANIKMNYYNTGIHRSAFMLPSFVQANLKAVLDPLP